MSEPRWSVEAWEIPGASPFQRRVMDVPGVLEFTQPASGVGRCNLSIPEDWGRLDEILDPANDVGSLLRVIEKDRSGDPQIRAEYLLRRTATPRKDAGNLIQLTSPSIEDALEWAIVYPYDWPPEIFTANWIYGGEGSVGSFRNGGMEDSNLNGDAETGVITPWESTVASADTKAPDSDVVIDDTDPRSGTFCFEVDPSEFHSGFARKNLRVIPGEQYVFSAFLKEPSNSGDRFTMGIQMGPGSVLDVGAKVYNDVGIAELDGAGYQAGASDGTYQTLDATVTFGPNVIGTDVWFLYDEHPSGNGALFRVDDITVVGPGIGLEPWDIDGAIHPDVFEIDTGTFRSGTQSMKWKVNAGSGAGGSSVFQAVTGLTVGKTYTFGGFFQHDGGGNEPIRMLVFKSGGVWVENTITQIPTGAQFTYASVTFVAPETDLWFDFRYVDAGASPNFWIDDLNIAEGLPPANIGVIGLALLADAQTDHTGEAGDLARATLLWLKADFTASLDSAGNAWRADESLTIVRGKTYGKVLSDDFAKLGYEYRIKPNPDFGSPDSESHILQIFNPADLTTRVGGASNDLVGTIGFSGGSVVKGPVVKTPKSRTVALAEGDALQFAVAKDAAGVSAWGARELYLSEPDVLDPSTLTQSAATALVERGAAITATRITIVDDDEFSPWIDFEPGDWVRGELPPDLPRGNHRIVAITGTIAEGNALFDLDIGAHVFVGASGMHEAVSRMLAKFEKIEAPIEAASAAAIIGASFKGPIEQTYLVAAADTRPEIRALADFVCDGVDDEEEINAALAAVQASSSDGGIVQLTEGTFLCGDQVVSTGGSKAVWLRGAGRNATRIESDGNAPSPRAGLVELAAHNATLTDVDVSIFHNGYIAVIDIDVTSNSAGTLARVTAYMGSPSDAVLTRAINVGNDMTLTDVEVTESSKGDGIVVESARVNIDGAQIHSATTDGGAGGWGIAIATTNAHHCRIHDSFIENCATAGIWIGSDDCIVIGNDAEDDIIVNTTADRTILGGNNGTIINNGTLTRIFDETGFFNGTFLETQSVTIAEAGGTVTMSLEKTGGGELTMRFSDGRTNLDTDPALTIALTTGTDAAPTTNYIYILQSDKILTKSTTEWPTAEHIKVAFFFVPSAAFVAAEGVVIHQDWTDHAADTSDQGHMSHVVEHIRSSPAVWNKGLLGAGVDDYLTIVGGTVDLKVAAGVVYQLHRHTVPAFDTSGGDLVLVKNWFGDSFHDITNLFDIVDDSLGDPIANNRYFNLVVWGVANQTGGYAPTIINLPAGTYTSQAAAEADLSGFDDFTMPRQFVQDSSTGFLICRLTIQHKNTTWEYKSTTDLRGTTPQSAAGGASATTTTFLDNQFEVVNVSDVTRILQLDVSAVTTGNTRTLIVPDADGTIALQSYVDTADALKLDLAGGTMGGAIAMSTFKITGLGDPSAAQDAATKAYSDLNLDLAGTRAMTGDLDMDRNSLINVTGIHDSLALRITFGSFRDVLTRAEMLMRASNYSGSGDWLDETANGHDGVITGAMFLSQDGTQYVRHPGADDNYMSTPNAAALQLTTLLDIQWFGSLDDWTPGSFYALVAKFKSNTEGYELDVTDVGTLRLIYVRGGANRTPVSTVAPTVNDGDLLWVRVTRDSSSGDVKFYTGGSAATPSWVQLGDTVSTTTGAITTGTLSLEIGRRSETVESGTDALLLLGTTRRVRIYADLTEATTVFDADLTDMTALVEPFATFTEASSNAATVTLNRSATGYKLEVVDQAMFVFDGVDDIITIADDAGLDFAEDEDFTLMILGRILAATDDGDRLFDKRVVGGGAEGYLLTIEANRTILGFLDGGTPTALEQTADTVTLGEQFVTAMRRDTGASEFEVFLDGAGSTASADATVSIANAVAATIGDRLAGDKAISAQIHHVVLWREALSSVDMASAVEELLGTGGDMEWRKQDGTTATLRWNELEDRIEIVNTDLRIDVDQHLDIAAGVPLGGGAAATLATIGGGGPGTAAQSQWVEIKVDEVIHWIPAWL